MKKKYLYLIVIVSMVMLTKGNAQNLVPNPSFEDTVSCPNNISQIDRSVGWYSSMGTPDYFNSCAISTSYVSVPYNWQGYRTPASGNAYAGIIARYQNTDNFKEAIGTQLLAPMQIGVKYYASFKVSLGSVYANIDWCGINKLGILFSTIPYNSLSPAPTCSNCAQIWSDSIVIDTINWTRLVGSFVADSNYLYISIGRFNYNSLTDSLLLTSSQCNSYYYIDDVCVSTDSLYAENWTGITLIDNKKNETLIFPNPARDWIEIGIRDLKNIIIYDVLGNKCYQSSVTNSYSVTVNVSSFDRGIYFLKMETDKENIYKKIIIQ